MSENNKNKDVFLQSIGKVQPLRKSNKNFKKLNLSINRKVKEIKLADKSNDSMQKIEVKTKIKKNNLKIESSSVLKKLNKGKIPIDKKIDFHGLSIEKAKSKFFNTINECFYSNKRCILFITGKGMKKINQDTADIKLFHGRIRENFKEWIFEKEAISKILNVAPAGFLHGGDGAFFVYLRKNKN